MRGLSTTPYSVLSCEAVAKGIVMGQKKPSVRDTEHESLLRLRGSFPCVCRCLPMRLSRIAEGRAQQVPLDDTADFRLNFSDACAYTIETRSGNGEGL